MKKVRHLVDFMRRQLKVLMKHDTHIFEDPNSHTSVLDELKKCLKYGLNIANGSINFG